MTIVHLKPSLDLFPNEILQDIVSKIAEVDDLETLINLRSVSHSFEVFANKYIFRHVQVGICERSFSESSKRFLHVARSAKLRCNVKEITINTNYCSSWNGFTLMEGDDNFINTLPYMRYFQNTKVLSIFLHDHCGTDADRSRKLALSHWILNTAFHCLAGTYTIRVRNGISNPVRPLLRTIPFGPQEPEMKLEMKPIPLEKLSISTWDDNAVLQMAESIPFNTVCSHPSFNNIELSVLTSIETTSLNRDYGGVNPPRLLHTWLRPSLDEHLRSLSLIWCHEIYNDCLDRLQTQACCPGKPRNGAPMPPMLPCLKKLILHGYVFIYEWQVAWICALRKGGNSLGVEWLELVDCCIAARRVLSEGGTPELALLSPTSLEWHRIFGCWTDLLPAIKVFHFETSCWPPPLLSTVESLAQRQLQPVPEHRRRMMAEDGSLPRNDCVDAVMVESEPASAKELMIELTKKFLYNDLLEHVDEMYLAYFPLQSITLQDPIVRHRQETLKTLDQQAFALIKSTARERRRLTNTQ